MGAQPSFLNSKGALFDVLSEPFRALPSESNIGINCHRG
jgi:hypothetical protein